MDSDILGDVMICSMTSKEEIQLKLELIHNHTKQEDEKHRADIRPM